MLQHLTVRSNTSCGPTDALDYFRALKVTSQVATPGRSLRSMTAVFQKVAKVRLSRAMYVRTGTFYCGQSCCLLRRRRVVAVHSTLCMIDWREY